MTIFPEILLLRTTGGLTINVSFHSDSIAPFSTNMVFSTGLKKDMDTEQPDQRVVEFQRAGMGVEATGHLRLSSRGMQKTAFDGRMDANGSSEMNTKSSSRSWDETRYNFTSHRSSGNRDTHGIATRKDGEAEHRTTQAVQFQLMMGKLAARTAAVLLSVDRGN